jgi:hypothetical protein
MQTVINYYFFIGKKLPLWGDCSISTPESDSEMEEGAPPELYKIKNRKLHWLKKATAFENAGNFFSVPAPSSRYTSTRDSSQS